MVLIYLECHLHELFPLNLEGIRLVATEERFSIRMQLRPGCEDERRCIRVTREGFSVVTLEGMTQHVLLDESSGLVIFGEELSVDFGRVLRVIREVTATGLVDRQTPGLATVMEDVVRPSALRRQSMLRDVLKLGVRLIRDGPLVVSLDSVELEDGVQISVAIRHVEAVLVDGESASLLASLHLVDQIIEVLRHGRLLSSVVLATSFQLSFSELDQQLGCFLAGNSKSAEGVGKSRPLLVVRAVGLREGSVGFSSLLLELADLAGDGEVLVLPVGTVGEVGSAIGERELGHGFLLGLNQACAWVGSRHSGKPRSNDRASSSRIQAIAVSPQSLYGS